MPPNFLIPPLDRLNVDGRIERLSPGAAWLRPQVALARELCSFELFQPPGVDGAALAAAARLHAVAAAPYVRFGHLVRRRGHRCEIWWWNLDRVEPALQAAGRSPGQVVPESLLQPPGTGWRIVRSGGGYEAQVWDGDALVASRWRRTAYDRAAWSAFVRAAPDGSEAPSQPPAAEWLPFSRRALLGLSPMEPSAANMANVAGVAALAVTIAVSGFALGQGLRLQSMAEQTEREAQVVTRAASRQGSAAQIEAKARLDAYRRLSERPNGMTALARALSLVRREGLHPSRFAIDADHLSITVPYDEIGRTEGLVERLANAGFSEVKPMADAQDRTIQLQMRFAASPAG